MLVFFHKHISKCLDLYTHKIIELYCGLTFVSFEPKIKIMIMMKSTFWSKSQENQEN